MQPITPYLLYEDGEAAIEFLTRAFGFREVDREIGSAGGLHAELELPPHGGRIYLGQPRSGFRNPSVVGATMDVFAIVDDVEAHYARAKAEGATVTQELNDTPFGHRQYGCSDPQGHEWYFAQQLDARDA
jgi:PhnB protein